MSREENALLEILCPRVRGLILDVASVPLLVVAETLATAPKHALQIEVDYQLSSENLDTETLSILSEKLKEGLVNWRLTQKPDNQQISIPSCVFIKGKAISLAFWIAEEYDQAIARQKSGDAQAWRLDAHLDDSTQPARLLKNRIALVTGGAQGFGEEIVRGLVAQTCLVYIADLNLDKANQLANQLNKASGSTRAIAIASNVADEASVEAMFGQIARSVGGLDLCVSNAGVLKAGSVLEQDLAAFKFVTDVNYTGFFIVSKHAGRLLKAQNSMAPQWTTDIVQINSKSGLEGSNKNGAYAGGKFGGIGLVASFALELVQYGIKVNAICPGNFFDGPLWSDPEKGLFVQYLRTGKVPGALTIADVKTFYENKVPMKRGCTGQDVMRALFYLVEQQYETGQALPVTGGQVMLH